MNMPGFNFGNGWSIGSGGLTNNFAGGSIAIMPNIGNMNYDMGMGGNCNWRLGSVQTFTLSIKFSF